MEIEETLRSVAYPLLRTAAFCANALLFGLAPVILLVLRPALASGEASGAAGGRRRVGARLEGLVGAALAASAVSTVLVLILQAVAISELGTGEVDSESIKAVFETSFGQWYAARLVMLCGLAVVLVGKVGELAVAPRDERGAGPIWWTTWVLLAACVLATSSLSGHAAVAEPAAVAIANDMFHLVAGSVWFAGVVVLSLVLPDAWAGRPPLRRLALLGPAVDRFATIALVSIVAAGVTGVINAWLHVGAFDDLIDTGYGRTIVVKLCLFAAIVGFGAVNHYLVRRHLRDALREGRPTTAPRVFRRTIAAELLIAVMIMAATGLLVGLGRTRLEAASSAAAGEYLNPSG